MGALISKLFKLIPQKYMINTTDGFKIAEINQAFNPFVLKYTMNVASQNNIDKRLIIAAGILLAGIERKQQWFYNT